MNATSSRPSPLRRWRQRRSAAVGSALLVALVALVALLGARAAHADCGARAPAVELTYPDEATESVPPDAVFWVVSPGGDARAWVDGVPLSPRGPSGRDRHQFVYPTLLGEGEHELVARAGNDDRRAVTFRVSAGAPFSGDARIQAVDLYPLARGPSGWLDPPGYDAECAWLATPLGDYCNDTIDGELARIRLSGEGDVVAYLVQGWLVPAACTTFVTQTWSSDPEQYTVAAVLPTGVVDERTYDGTIEVHTIEEAYPDLFSRPSACSLGAGKHGPSALDSVGLALVAWLVRRRRATQ